MVMRNGNSVEWLAEVENRVKRLACAIRSGNRAMASHEARELHAASGILEEELVFEGSVSKDRAKVNGK